MIGLGQSVEMLFSRLDGIPEPPEGYVPPLGSSRNTWANIYKNKGRIDYCVQQFGVSFVPFPVSVFSRVPVSISSAGLGRAPVQTRRYDACRPSPRANGSLEHGAISMRLVGVFPVAPPAAE